MRNPSKLLEKSKSLELNVRKFLSENPRIKKLSMKIYLEEDVVVFKKKLMVIYLILWKTSLRM
jgi:hypothetical protein